MQFAFPERSNTDIDSLVTIASSRMTSHLRGRLFVPAFSSDDLDEDEALDREEPVELDGPVRATRFNPIPRRTPLPLVAVDSGVTELGMLSGGGVAIAVRASAVLHTGTSQHIVLLYNTGGIVIDAGSRIPVFHYIGSRLGDEGLFVELSSTTPTLANRTPMRTNEIRSACRSFVERMVTEEAIALLASLGGGTLLIDGALPPKTFDLPYIYVQEMLNVCASNGVDVVAISKRTRHTVNGSPIASLFDGMPHFVGYAPIRNFVDSMRANSGDDWRDISAAAEVYAARFSMAPSALTFRVDVHNCHSSLASEVIERVYTDIQLYGGYPLALIQAHQHSSFIGFDAMNLVADLAAKYGLRIEPERSMDVLFQPFNAFGK